MPIYQCISPEGRGSTNPSGKSSRPTGQPEEGLLASLWETPAENAMDNGSILAGIGQE
jgi:hypothetical protein